MGIESVKRNGQGWRCDVYIRYRVGQKGTDKPGVGKGSLWFGARAGNETLVAAAVGADGARVVVPCLCVEPQHVSGNAREQAGVAGEGEEGESESESESESGSGGWWLVAGTPA